MIFASHVLLRGRECGNALFLILIAVALFAALAYAVTQSGRGGGSIKREQAMLYASQIVQVGAVVKAAVQRMRLQGAGIDEIFSNTPSNKHNTGVGTLNGYADACQTGANCLFAPEGGGLNPPTLPREAFLAVKSAAMTWVPTSYFGGSGSFNGWNISGLSPPPATNQAFTPVTGQGTAAAEDMFEIYPLKVEVCEAINNGLGISGIPVTAVPPAAQTVPGNPEIFCSQRSGTDIYVFYQVLIAR